MRIFWQGRPSGTFLWCRATCGSMKTRPSTRKKKAKKGVMKTHNRVFQSQASPVKRHKHVIGARPKLAAAERRHFMCLHPENNVYGTTEKPREPCGSRLFSFSAKFVNALFKFFPHRRNIP